MLPNPDHRPPAFRQAGIRSPVSIHVASELLSPPLTIALWQNTVIWAHMPETAINEHGDTFSGKHHVRL